MVAFWGAFTKMGSPNAPGLPEGAGFPFFLPVGALSIVEQQIALRRFSIQSLAKKCRARKLWPHDPSELFNINTPEEWRLARKVHAS